MHSRKFGNDVSKVVHDRIHQVSGLAHRPPPFSRGGESTGGNTLSFSPPASSSWPDSPNLVEGVFSEVRKGTRAHHLTRLSPSYAGCSTVVASAGAGPRQDFQSKITNPIATAIAT